MISNLLIGMGYVGLLTGMGVLALLYLDARAKLLKIQNGDAGLGIFRSVPWTDQIEVSDKTLVLSRATAGRHAADDASRTLVSPDWMPLIGARLQSAWAAPSMDTTPGWLTVSDLQQAWSNADPLDLGTFVIEPRRDDLVGSVR